MAESMHCVVYRSRKTDLLYLFVEERDDFSAVPEELLKSMGALEFSMELELTPERPLARAQAAEVMASLKERGYYVQMPPPERTL